MTRLILIILIVLSPVSAGFAQMHLQEYDVLDTTVYRVIYNYTWTDPTTERDMAGYMVLNIGRKMSKFETYPNYRGDSLAHERRDGGYSMVESMAVKRGVPGVPTPSLIRNHTRKDSIRVDNSFFSFNPQNLYRAYYYDSAPQTEWNLTGKKKFIDELEVQEATGRVYGRDWTIWFAESLPYFEGPWELAGAPGLIVEARDSNWEHEFSLTEMFPVKTPILIMKQSDSNAKKITREAFRKYRDDFTKKKVRQALTEKAFPPLTNFPDIE